MKPLNLLIGAGYLAGFASAANCPSLTCNMGDKTLLDKSLCYKHSAIDPVSYIKIEKCQDDIHGNKFRCMMDKGEYAWVHSDYQFDESRTTKE